MASAAPSDASTAAATATGPAASDVDDHGVWDDTVLVSGELVPSSGGGGAGGAHGRSGANAGRASVDGGSVDSQAEAAAATAAIGPPALLRIIHFSGLRHVQGASSSDPTGQLLQLCAYP